MPVSLTLANEIYHIEVWHILSLLLSVVVNYYIYLNARKSTLLYTYLLTQGMLVIWIVAKIFKTAAYDLALRWAFVVMQYFGVSFLGACLLLFAYVYTKRKMPKPLPLVLLFLPALYCFGIVVTNPIHFQFYATMTFYSDHFGQLFYVNMFISYAYLAVSIFLLSRGFFKMFGNERNRAALFAGAIIVPFIINAFYVFKLFKLLFGHTPLFDYTPLATNVSLMFFALSAMKYRFFDILPMAKRQIFESLSDAVVVCEKHFHVCDYNHQAQALFPSISRNDPFDELQDTVEINEKVYAVFKCTDKHFIIYRLSDITKISNMIADITKKNDMLSETKAKLQQMLSTKKQLIAVKAGNYILQELHDVLGHATVLAISACEIEIINGANHYDDTLYEIKKLLIESQLELKLTLESNDNPSRRTSLTIAIDSLIQNATASRLTLTQTIQGEPFELDSRTSQAIFRMCQEAITNCLKHSNATEQHIVLRYSETCLEIFIIDNGEGCEHIACGRGLCGMKERIESVGGVLKFTSDIHCGFRIDAKLERGEINAL